MQPNDTRVGAVLKAIGLDASGAAVGVACDAMVPGGPSCEYTAACCTNNGFVSRLRCSCSAWCAHRSGSCRAGWSRWGARAFEMRRWRERAHRVLLAGS